MKTLVQKLLHSPTPWVMAITLGGMGFSLLVHFKLIPTRFGVSENADTLVATLKSVLLVDTVFREGAKFSLVPLFVTQETVMSSAAYRRFTNGILIVSLCLGAILAMLIAGSAPWIANGLLPQHSLAARAEMATLLRLGAPLVLFGCGSTATGAFLNSQRRFKTVALRNALPPALAAGAFFLLWETPLLARWIAVAYTIGAGGYFVWLCIETLRTGHRYELTRPGRETLHALKSALTLPTLGFAIRQLSTRLFVEVYLIGQFGAGLITLYNSAFRIFSAIQTLIGISLATTALPNMATHHAEKEHPASAETQEKSSRQDKQNRTRAPLQKNARAAVLIAFPVTLGMLIAHEQIIKGLYGQSSLSHAAMQLIADLLFWLSAGMIFSCLIPMLNAGLYAQKAYGLVFRNMVTMAVLNISVAYACVATSWWVLGIALAVSISAILAVVNLTYLLRKTGISWM